jgi:hypothetical protein
MISAKVEFTLGGGVEESADVAMTLLLNVKIKMQITKNI